MSEANVTDPSLGHLFEVEQYVNTTVEAALKAQNITKASPGFHNARFVAAEAVRMTLFEMGMSERDELAAEGVEV